MGQTLANTACLEDSFRGIRARCGCRRADPTGSIWIMAIPEPFEFMQIHHVQLAIPTGGEDRSRAFWRDLLGLVELEKPPALAGRGGCWFRGGGLEVHLGVEGKFAPAHKAHPGIQVSDIARLAALLDGAGVVANWDSDFPGYRRFYANDPFGNRLEFMERLTPNR